MLLPERDQPLRTKLNKFLRDKENYNTSHLLSLVRGSWMKEEEINLLAKEERYDQAIMILVENGSHEAAEAFCNMY